MGLFIVTAVKTSNLTDYILTEFTSFPDSRQVMAFPAMKKVSSRTQELKMRLWRLKAVTLTKGLMARISP
jgi:hypothetical protein